MEHDMGEKWRDEKGFALIFVVIIVFIVAMVALASSQTSTGGRWLSGNYLSAKQAFYAAEAGTQDAISRFLSGAIVDTATNSPTWNSGNSYSSAGSDFTNSFTVTHWVSGGSVVTDGSGNPYYAIRSTGYDGPAKGAQKTVQIIVSLTRASPFTAGVVGCGNISVSGRAIIDSYDSSKGSYASQVGAGGYAGSADYAQTCTANGNITLSGGADIYGTASATGVVTTSGGAAVHGTTLQHQPTSSCDTLDVANLVSANRPGGTPTRIQLSGNATQTFTAPGTVYLSGVDLSGHSVLTVAGTGAITVFIDGNLSISGQAAFIIQSTAKVTMYVTGTISDSGGGVVNQGLPTNLVIYDSNSGSNGVNLSGGSGFTGAIYAPLTDISVSGGGNFMGAARGKTVTDTGTASFHYDVSLKNMTTGGITGFTVIDWQEVFN
ncbi:MAG: PilX N-terminal domain-containing pilus assembly protein [Syntrophorhabdales bacterium]|jgi:hypothetical protein